MSAIAVLVGSAAVIDVVSGTVSVWSLGFYVLLVLIFAAVMIWLTPRFGDGFIELLDNGFLVNTKIAKHRFCWMDVERIDAGPWAPDKTSRVWRLIVGKEADRVVVKVTTRKSPRMDFWSSDTGTESRGIPNPFLKIVAWDLEDPHEFVRAVQPFLTPPPPPNT